MPLPERPRIYIDEDDVWPDPPISMDVLVEDSEPRETGLLDQYGNKIMRVVRRVPIGFCR